MLVAVINLQSAQATFSGIVILQVKNNSFTDCHTEGLIVKANLIFIYKKKKKTRIALLLKL